MPNSQSFCFFFQKEALPCLTRVRLKAGWYNVARAAELGLTPGDAARADQAELGMRRDEASCSTRGQRRVVAGSEHFIQLQKPNAVIEAVRVVVDETRNK
jgi:hypothetical protein